MAPPDDDQPLRGHLTLGRAFPSTASGRASLAASVAAILDEAAALARTTQLAAGFRTRRLSALSALSGPAAADALRGRGSAAAGQGYSSAADERRLQTTTSRVVSMYSGPQPAAITGGTAELVSGGETTVVVAEVSAAQADWMVLQKPLVLATMRESFPDLVSMHAITVNAREGLKPAD